MKPVTFPNALAPCRAWIMACLRYGCLLCFAGQHINTKAQNSNAVSLRTSSSKHPKPVNVLCSWLASALHTPMLNNCTGLLPLQRLLHLNEKAGLWKQTLSIWCGCFEVMLVGMEHSYIWVLRNAMTNCASAPGAVCQWVNSIGKP